MIGSLEIENLKCFKAARFAMRPLTVLTGVNGGGKSTVLQSLLLARTAASAPHQAVLLNGPMGLALGEARDVLNWAAEEPRIRVRLEDPAGGEPWGCTLALPKDEHALHLNPECGPVPPSLGIGRSGPGFTYLCAERLGPRDTLSVSAEEPELIGVGVQGEFTAQVLALRETRAVQSRRAVRRELRHPDIESPLPRLQAEAWASDIIRPIRITAQMAVGIMASTVRFAEVGQGAEQVRPMNTGFGVSYALPLIVAGLLTEPGDFLLIENPEAHLHPAGQSRLGRFLARVAGSGVQVVVETHSDHVLNGARLAVAQDRSIPANDMIAHYFGHEQNEPIRINGQGELSHWPSGFFDQIESDLGRLARARRSR
ncbi:AAA family ATPase [Streptomyces microflavus]|uniref:AAA family ATPase n=1 Tax=Streptomyces microflavus TaxID=1919 RepID=UPI0037F95B1B